MEHIRRVHANRDTQTCSDSRGPEIHETESESDSVFATSSDSSDDELKRVKPKQLNTRKLKSVCARKLPSQPERKTSNLPNQDDSSQSEKGNSCL